MNVSRPLLAMILGLALAAGTGCQTATPVKAGSLQRFSFEGPAMGTLFLMTFYATNQASAEAAADAAFKRIAALDDVLSDYQADSELSLLRDKPVGVPIPVSDDLFAVLQRGESVSRATGGAFDTTIGPFVRLWRFSRKRRTLPSPAELTEARAAVGWHYLKLDAASRTVTKARPGMRLDVGGIAKGFAADEARRVLALHGIRRTLVAASGDISLGDPPPGHRGWRVQIAGLTNVVPASVVLHNCGISTSGDLEQFVDIGNTRYSHIVSPWTGLGLTNRIQATVIARDATTTDALATALSVLGVSRGLNAVARFPGASARISEVTPQGARTLTSKGFPSLQFGELEDPMCRKGSGEASRIPDK
jgi:thiamine biosynthesis lipoprotein